MAPGQAQMTASDLVIRLERIENHMRQLTGAMEQLQYRNQQLEGQVRALITLAGNPARSTPNSGRLEAALAAGLAVIACVGETEGEREAALLAELSESFDS